MALDVGSEELGLTEVWSSYPVPAAGGFRFFVCAAALEPEGTFISVPLLALTISTDGEVLKSEQWTDLVVEHGFTPDMPALSSGASAAPFQERRRQEQELEAFAERLRGGEIAALGGYRRLFNTLVPPEQIPYYRRLEPDFFEALG